MGSQPGSDNDRPAAILTPAQREYLRGERQVSGASERALRSRIRERCRESLRDFGLLADELSEKDIEQVFAAEPNTDEYRDLETDVTKSLRFLYVGLGGESQFRKPLKHAVMNGEVALGNTEYTLNVTVRFAVDTKTQYDVWKAAEAVEAKDWNNIYPPDLFAFISLALRADAIDFDAVDDELEHKEQLKKLYEAGPEIFEKVNESAEELSEK